MFDQEPGLEEGSLRPIRNEEELAAVLAEPRAVLYKHSPLCGLSTIAADQVRRFREESPGTPVYIVDVIRQRGLSGEVERRLGVRHESPQVIVLKDGVAVWSGSHRGVTAEALHQVIA